MKLLVLAHDNFNDMELTTTISILERSKLLQNVTYYNPSKKIIKGQHNIVKLNCVNTFKIEEFDAIFIPGGKGTKLLRQDSVAIKNINDFKNSNKYIFAICDAPNVLFENKIINENIPFSSYPIDSIKNILSKRNDFAATAFNKIITGKGPAASTEFALLILKVYYDEKISEKIRKEIYAI
ncbi:monophosphate biosynthesis [Mycoplasmopsis maculosa]|uniref:Monophosphate biosynthesis n=1 Tax=Mycoplasmopsis maculosa TaxID=114885 RepID=A0A449B5F2_9BACT|nr:DJ-1/PfpI family protein [Mycoplasmopsis maculosa]VEU75812.1 monophosphate biosynthesis [Mycoplasmopsis maculosa]